MSAIFLRNSGSTVFGQDGVGATTLRVGQANYVYGPNTTHAMTFSARVGSASSDIATISVTAGLTPGTYSTSRLPGQGDALLDPGSFMSCGGDEPGTLTIDSAAYGADGTPTEFAASFDIASCDSIPPAHGEIRWNSGEPLGLAAAPEVSAVASTVLVNSTAELTVTMTAAGNASTVMGAAQVDQTALPDGSRYWSLVDDGCAGRVLAPGQTCPITVRIAPKRPNGYPQTTTYASVVVPDGQPIPARATIRAVVAPLPGQPVNLAVRGAYEHLVLTWGAPRVVPSGWPTNGRLLYRIYEVMPDGRRALRNTVWGGLLYRVPAYNGTTATYVVTASPGGSVESAESVQATGTTSRTQLLQVSPDRGILETRLAPDPDTVAIALLADGDRGEVSDGADDLAVSADQTTLAWTHIEHHEDPVSHAVVRVTRVDDSSGYDFDSAPSGGPMAWDIDPALSTHGTSLVYTHSASPSAPSVLRFAYARAGQTATDVPNSAGLRQAAFAPDAESVIAVQPTGASTRLVRLDLETGKLTAIPNTSGLTEPDVSRDGRIVAQRSTDPSQPNAIGLVMISAPGAAPIPIASAQAGVNVNPKFAANGRSVFYTHRDDFSWTDVGEGYAVDLLDGTSSRITGGSDDATPYVLRNGETDPDHEAPRPVMLSPVAAVVLGMFVTATWQATDVAGPGIPPSGVRDFDVRYQATAVGRPRGAYRSVVEVTTAHEARLLAAPGIEYCFSVRARDLAGNTSDWSAAHCTTTPVDDRALRVSSSVIRYESSGTYLRTVSRATGNGSQFIRPDVKASRIGVIVSRSPLSGTVDVFLGGTRLGRISTRTPTVRYQQVIWLPAGRVRSGALVVRTVGARSVYVDGVVIAR